MAAHLDAGGIVRKLFFFLALAAAALAVLAAPSASAARSATPRSETAAVCPGGTLLTAVSAQRLPAGATAYKYKLTNGTSFENIGPPSGFNYATASNAVLAELNMPRRPTGAAAMKAWKAQVAPFAKSRISRSEKFCEMAKAAPEPEASTVGRHAVSATPLVATGSTGFAGYTLMSPPYERAFGIFTQPNTGTDTRSMSTWIGINGTGSGGRLIQAGAGNEDYAGSSPFWEQYCSGGSAAGCNTAVIATGVYVVPGNEVSIMVAFSKSSLISYYQVSIGPSLVINATDPMQAGSNSGNVVNFFTERTGGDNIPTFTSIPFSSSETFASISSNTSVPFGSQKNAASEMTANGNYYTGECSNSNVLIYPSVTNSGGFTNHYCRST
jgi:hypothetical protein